MATAVDTIVPDSEASGKPGSGVTSMASDVPASGPTSSPPPAAVHVAPKRTYARARPLGPTVPSLAVPAPVLSPNDIVLSSTQENTVRSPSPVEDRSPARTPAWKRLARREEEDRASDDEEDEVDDDEVERAMAAMRGGGAAVPAHKSPAPAEEEFSRPAANPLLDDSLLTAPATSSSLPPLTSSPSRRSALSKQDSTESIAPASINLTSQPTSLDEETMPIRRGTAHRSTATGKRRAVFSDEDEEEDMPVAGPSSPRRVVSPSRSEEGTPQPAERSRQKQASPAGSDNFDLGAEMDFGDVVSPEPAASRRPAVRSLSPADEERYRGRRSALQELAEKRRAERNPPMEILDEDTANTPVGRSTRPARRPAASGSDLSDEDHDVRLSGKGKNAREVKIKGLAKKEQLEMEKQQAMIRAGKSHNLGLLVNNAIMPPSEFARQQAAKISQTSRPMHSLSALNQALPPVPALTHDDKHDVSSDMEATPNDDIAAFSSIRSHKEGEGLGHPLHSSPVPFRDGAKANSLMLKPASKKSSRRVVLDDDDEDLPDIASMFSHQPDKSKMTIEQKKAKLALQKRKAQEQLALAQMGAGNKGRPTDEDLDIEAAPVALAKKPRLGASASAVLSFEHDGSSKSKQQFAKMSGRALQIKETATESMQQHGGKEFAHGAALVRDGPYRAPGLKQNKIRAITPAQLQVQLLANAKRDAAKEARQKEEESGIKGKMLPERSALALLEPTAAPIAELGKDDSEDDDGEYKPPAGERLASPEESDDEMPAMLPDDDLELALSGEDEDEPTEEHQADVEDKDTEHGANSDKENVPPKQPSNASISSPPRMLVKATAHKRARIVDSDDEDARPAPVRAAPTQAPGEAPGSIELDMGGGFSQFFDATQGESLGCTEPAGFNAMRHEAPPTLAAANKLLPSFDVTSTAAERDAALLQAEVEIAGAAQDAASSPVKPPTQYVNEKGFFTQTRPAAPSEPGPIDEDSFVMDSLPTASRVEPESLLSATYRTQRQSSSPDGAKPLRKLRARSPTPEADVSGAQDSHASLEATQLDNGQHDVTSEKPADAFATLMASKGEAAAAPPRTRPKIDLRDFVEDQADESDEEDAFGIGGRRDEDGEEDEDMDQPVEGLVDDQERTLEEQEADRKAALEKLREIEAEDDKRAQELAQKAVEGKFRGRRRDGTMGDLDISDEDEDEDGHRRKRSKRPLRELGKENALSELPPDHPYRKLYEDALSDHEDDTEQRPIYEEEPVARSPSPRAPESVDVVDVNKEIRAAAKQNRELQATRSLDRSQPMVDLDSDDEDTPAGPGGFQILRQRPAIKPSRPSADKDKRLQALLDNETPSDSRRAGGNSSVSQLKSGPAAAKTGSTFRGGAKQASTSRAVPKKQSSMSSAVMVKTRGFE